MEHNLDRLQLRITGLVDTSQRVQLPVRAFEGQEKVFAEVLLRYARGDEKEGELGFSDRLEKVPAAVLRAVVKNEELLDVVLVCVLFFADGTQNEFSHVLGLVVLARELENDQAFG